MRLLLMIKPLFTIIIPHYNTPDLLVRCLASIPVRDDVQVIVVDDCSPGADMYFKQYPGLNRPNLEFYSTTQGGSAGRARNVGLQHAEGQWVLFADADDYYVEGFLDKISDSLYEGLDILYFDVAGEGARAEFHRSLFKYAHDYHDDNEIRYRIWTPWNKVFSRHFIEKNNLQFEEVRVGNDAMFCLSASRLAQEYRIIDSQLYCLTDNSESITFKKLTFEREYEYTQVRIRLTRFLEDLGLDLRYGYNLFSISRMKRFCSEYGIANTLIYMKLVSSQYGIMKAMLYNYKRKKLLSRHSEYIHL